MLTMRQTVSDSAGFDFMNIYQVSPLVTVTDLNSRSLTSKLPSSLLWEAQVLEMLEMFNRLLSFIVTFSQEPSLFLTLSVAL